MSRKLAFSIGIGAILIAGTIQASVFESLALHRYQRLIELELVNELEERRVVFQSVHLLDPEGEWLPGSNLRIDNSVTRLFVATPEKTYIIADGHEPQEELAIRKRNYWTQQQKWERETRLLVSLKRQERDRARLAHHVGDNHPEVVAMDRAILNEIRQNDHVLLELLNRRKRAEGELYDLNRQYGFGSDRAAAQQVVIDGLTTEIQSRELLWRELARKTLAQESATPGEGAQPDPTAPDGMNSGDSIAQLGEKLGLAEPVEPVNKFEFFPNQVDGSPNYMLVANPVRREVNLERVDEGESTWVEQNFGDFYRSVRDRHLNRYAAQFRDLVTKPGEFNATVQMRQRLVVEGASANTDAASATDSEPAPTQAEQGDARWLRRVDVSANDGTHYTAIDANGDGVTETFLVKEPGSFHWGDQQLPNVILIYNNQEEGVRGIIGDLVTVAATGSDDYVEELTQSRDQVLGEIEGYIEQEEQISRMSIDSQVEQQMEENTNTQQAQ